MTTIAYRDGVMACDSRMVVGGSASRTSIKYTNVHENHGGGFAVLCGGLANVQALIAALVGGYEFPKDDEAAAIHINALGIATSIHGGWRAAVIDEFIADGSGFEIATGAMAMGASARRALEIACQYDICTGGKIFCFNKHGEVLE